MIIREEDKEVIIRTFTDLSPQGLSYTPNEFLELILMDTTWKWGDPSMFEGYIKRETHHELIRRGYKWEIEGTAFRDSESGFDSPELLTEETYQKTRKRVLESFTKCAIDYFKQDKANLAIPYLDSDLSFWLGE